MNTYHNISLKQYNTFGIEASAKIFIELNSLNDLYTLLSSKILNNESFFILGAGSNILFTKDFEGIIIHPIFKGIEIVETKNDFTLVKVFAGEVWDDFVSFCVTNQLG